MRITTDACEDDSLFDPAVAYIPYSCGSVINFHPGTLAGTDVYMQYLKMIFAHNTSSGLPVAC